MDAAIWRQKRQAKAALRNNDVVQNEYRDLQRLKTRKFGAFHLKSALIAKEKAQPVRLKIGEMARKVAVLNPY